MQRNSLSIVTAPTSYPVTRDEVKAFAKIDIADDDALIDSFIIAATQSAEEYLRRALITQTLALTLDLDCTQGVANFLGDGVYDLPVTALYGALPSVIELPKAPIQSITSIKTYSTANVESTFSSSNYYLDSAAGGRVVLNQSAVWTTDLRPKAAVKITYVAGYGLAVDVPQAIKTAILAHIQRMYDERLICDMPANTTNLLRQWRIYGESLR